MTRSDPPIQSWSLRSLPPLTWAMVLLGLIFVSTAFSSRQLSLPAMLAGLVPFLFAATVTYMKPSDPRFLYGAVLIGVGRGLSVLAILIASQGVVTGDLADMLFSAVALVDTPIELAGIVLIGMAAGGVHTRVGWAFVAAGVALAVLRAVAYVVFLPSLADSEAVLVVWSGLLLSLLFPIAWAFVAGAAFEHRHRLMLLGSVVLLAVEGALIAFTVLASNLSANLQPIALLIDVLQIAGWLLLAVSPLRLEMGTQRPLRDLAETEARS